MQEKLVAQAAVWLGVGANKVHLMCVRLSLTVKCFAVAFLIFASLPAVPARKVPPVQVVGCLVFSHKFSSQFVVAIECESEFYLCTASAADRVALKLCNTMPNLQR